MKHAHAGAMAAILALATWSGFHAPALAQSPQQYRLGDLVIRQPWTRATPKGAPVAAGYVTITNTGKTSDRLTGGSFASAGKFEIHAMSMTGGIMKMRQLPHGIAITPGATVTLKPGGFHFMFKQLKGSLAPGKPVKGSLTFEKAGTIGIEFTVAPIGSTMPPGQMH